MVARCLFFLAAFLCSVSGATENNYGSSHPGKTTGTDRPVNNAVTPTTATTTVAGSSVSSGTSSEFQSSLLYQPSNISLFTRSITSGGTSVTEYCGGTDHLSGPKSVGYQVCMAYTPPVAASACDPSTSLIDFETLPDTGALPTENMEISNQFQKKYGVTFALQDGTLPTIAKFGSQASTAYRCTSSDCSVDYNGLRPGQTAVGKFFLKGAKNATLSTNPSPLIITYDTLTEKASGSIMDLDTGETWVIEAIGVNGKVIDSVSFTFYGLEGDGIPTPFSFSHPTKDIKQIKLTGSKGSAIGLGFDNFFARGECSESPLLATGKWYQAVGQNCPTFCTGLGLQNVQSPDSWNRNISGTNYPFTGSSCTSGEIIPPSAVASRVAGTLTYSHGCWPNCDIGSANYAAQSVGTLCYGTNWGGGPQVRDADLTDITIGCYCK